MSIFGSIRDAIFGHEAQAAPQPQPGPGLAQAGQAQGSVQTAPAPRAPVDIEAFLIEVARGRGNPDLDWRHSIVDLMKLLALDSSLDNRKQLATELGYTGALDGSAEMNIWLHRRVLEELERNGAHVPASMKD